MSEEQRQRRPLPDKPNRTAVAYLDVGTGCAHWRLERVVPEYVDLVHHGSTGHLGYAEPSLTVSMTSEPWRVRGERDPVPLYAAIPRACYG